jgi:DNA-binding transcriptional regulator/RsmH inhibitor MraZ
VEKTKMELDQRGIKYVESLDEKGRIQLKAKFENKFTQSNFNTKLSTKF